MGMKETSRLNGYILKKRGDCYLTNDDKWKSFCNNTRHFATIEDALEYRSASKAKMNVIVVWDVYYGNNQINKYERKEELYG